MEFSTLNGYNVKDKKAIRNYANINEIINDSSLKNNNIIKSLDNGFTYKIVSDRPEDLPNRTNNNNLDNHYLSLNNGLYAVPINDLNNDYYDEITVTREIYENTTCYITTIPFKDSNNDEIIPYVKYNGGLDISDYARKHKTTLSMNCTLAVINPETELSENASVISDGEIIYNHMNPPSFLNDYYKFVGIKEGREFVDFQANETTAEQMLAQGVLQSFLCFGKLVDNGVMTSYAEDTTDDVMSNFYPRQTIGIKEDKTIIIITCDGRTVYDKGLTGEEIAQLLIDKGCINAWNLDGGGSANTVYKGSRVNKYTSTTGSSITERHIAYSLNFKKPTTNKNIDDVMSNIGREKANIIKMLLPQIPAPSFKNPANCNELIHGLQFYTCFNATNTPDNQTYGYLINIPGISANNTFFGIYSRQIWLSRDNNNIYVRSYSNEQFTRWQRLNTLFNAEVGITSNQTLGIGTNYKTIELGSVGEYMPSSLSVNNNNQIITNINGGIQVIAVFNIEAQLTSDVTIRLKKNNDNIKAVTIPVSAGDKKQIILVKQTSLSSDDTLEFTCNSNNNTGGVNIITGGSIEILQNI